MRPLRNTVPFGPGETPASFTSRLAGANRLPAREFCLDFGVRFQSVVNGDDAAIATIAQLGGADASALSANAFVKRGKRSYDFRGEHLDRDALRRYRIHVCPSCLMDDIRINPELPARLAIYNRALWTIDAIRTCSVHRVALIEMACESHPHRVHDFAPLVGPAVPGIERMAAEATRREPSALEKYVVARIEGVRCAPFLDSLELFAAIRTCETIGAVDVFGRKVNLRNLTGKDWLRAGARGFEIAGAGADGIEALLDHLRMSYPKPSGRETPLAFFGQLYLWLGFFGRRKEFDPVREVVGSYILSHFPLGPEDRLFGKAVAERRVHSICTLSHKAGMHTTRLRKTLRAAGIINDSQIALSDNLVLFDAAASEAVLRRCRQTITLQTAGRRIKAPPKQIGLIGIHGFMKPYLPSKPHSMRLRYEVGEVDAFLERLLAGAEPVARRCAEMMDIPSAARHARCKCADIIRLVLDGKLSWKGRLRGIDGYLSVLVKADEIRARLHSTHRGWLTKGQVIKRLHTFHEVVAALVTNKKLHVVRIIHPVTGVRQLVIPAEVLARFERKYVTVSQLAREIGRPVKTMIKILEDRRIDPAFPYEEIGARIYSRRKIKGFLLGPRGNPARPFRT